MITVSDNFDRAIYLNLVEIWMETGIWKSERGDDYAVIKNTIDVGGKIFYVTEEHKIMGGCWLTTDKRRLYLHHFAIAKDFQNRGYGKLLLQRVLDYAQSINLSIKLEVHSQNYQAISLYKKYGFDLLSDYQVYIIRSFNHLEEEK